MLKSITFCIVASLFLIVSCEPFPKDTTATTPGVSLGLAKNRKKQVSSIRYTLSVTIPGKATDSITGRTQIEFNLATNDMPLELDFEEKDNRITEIRVNGTVASIQHTKEHIILPKDLLIQGVNKIEISFSTNSQAMNRNDEFLYSLFVPARARSFMPCFDQPDLKACFSLTAIVPSDWEVISNGKVKKESKDSDKKTIEFQESDTISTYLFSIVAGKFNKQTKLIHKREFNFYYRETDTSKINVSIDSIFTLHDRSLAFMENYTGIPFPFQKLDFIAIPDFPYGGMEHAGAIDYRADALFLGRNAAESEQVERMHVIAHETAHMWFGNLVTMKWFDDVWMKEVFANFMADEVMASLMPDKNEKFHFLLQHHPSAYYVDRTEGTHPVRQELDNLDQARALYGTIIYDKAPIVIRQLKKLAGKEVLHRALTKYLKTFAYKNADWPDLIAILDELSSEDINEWNNNWINRKGRPTLDYILNASNGVVRDLTIIQDNPGNPAVWKQYFSIAFVYKDSIKTLTVNMNTPKIIVKEAESLPVPLFVLFNSTGDGYGRFPIDKNMLPEINRLKDPLLRASAYINIYENMLDGKTIAPTQVLDLYSKNLNIENEKLILTRMLRQFNNIYWQYMSPAQRQSIGPAIETAVWNAMQSAVGSKKRQLFLTYMNIALSSDATDKLYQIWEKKNPPKGLLLEEDDYIGIATTLAIKEHVNSEKILQEQSKRITNSDRKAEFNYTLPSLSKNIAVRDSFFNLLSDKDNRKNEVWVTKAIGYLHHPLRQKSSEKYIQKSLEVLEELQRSRGVFFSSDWLAATLGNYQTKSASQVVMKFLDENAQYNKKLRSKILQEADDLFRASRIIGN